MTGWYVLIFATACWLPIGVLFDHVHVNPEQWIAAHLPDWIAARAHLIDTAGRHR